MSSTKEYSRNTTNITIAGHASFPKIAIMLEPKISFKDSMLTALEGSIGYSIGGARVEVEVGYERFVIKGGKKSNEDTAS
ncbi:UNVERIFIED_ORG: hypothetical protein C0V67_03660, partial [Anaplasma ovis]